MTGALLCFEDKDGMGMKGEADITSSWDERTKILCVLLSTPMSENWTGVETCIVRYGGVLKVTKGFQVLQRSLYMN